MLSAQSVISQTCTSPFVNNSSNNLKSTSGPLLVSLKIGYHSASNSQAEVGFNGGLIFSGELSADIENGWCIGASFEYFNHKDDKYRYLGVLSPRKITGTGYLISCTKRNYFEFINTNFGLGIGAYNLNIDNMPGNNLKKYFPIKLLLGLELKVSNSLWISTDVSYTTLLNFDQSQGLFAFRIGPTLAFY